MWATPTLVSWIVIFHLLLICGIRRSVHSQCCNLTRQLSGTYGKILAQLGFFDSQLSWTWMTKVMKDSRNVRTFVLCMKGNSCVLMATFRLGSWSVAFTHWEVYWARTINIQLCRKTQLTWRKFFLMWDDFICYSLRCFKYKDYAFLAVFWLSLCIQQPEVAAYWLKHNYVVLQFSLCY